MATLTWSDAGKERPSLQSFTCADPSKAWELEVQSQLRSLRVPVGPPRTALLAWNGEEIAAAIVWIAYDGDYEMPHIQLVGVHVGQRGEGGKLAGDAIGIALDRMARDAVARGLAGPLVVTARTHEQNTPAHDLFIRSGFNRDPEGDAPPYLQWVLVVDILVDV